MKTLPDGLPVPPLPLTLDRDGLKEELPGQRLKRTIEEAIEEFQQEVPSAKVIGIKWDAISRKVQVDARID